MGAVAGIAGALLSSTSKSGQKDTIGQANASQSSALNIAQNNTPDIKSADVKAVSGSTDTTPTKTESSGSNVNWAELAKTAKSLLDSNASSGSSAPITANPASQANPLANFR